MVHSNILPLFLFIIFFPLRLFGLPSLITHTNHIFIVSLNQILFKTLNHIHAYFIYTILNHTLNHNFTHAPNHRVFLPFSQCFLLTPSIISSPHWFETHVFFFFPMKHPFSSLLGIGITRPALPPQFQPFTCYFLLQSQPCLRMLSSNPSSSSFK